MLRSLLKHRAGFTLLEILVSIGLIIVGVLGLSLNTVGVIRSNKISGNYTTASSLAQDKMEELLGPDTFTIEDNCPSDLTAIPFSSPADSNITATGSAGGIYNRCWTVANSSLGTDLKQISVSVSWRDYLTRTVTLVTLVYEE